MVNAAQRADEIIAENRPARELMKSGYKHLDYALGGFAKGEVSVISGTTGSGKSSFVSNVMLNLVDANRKVLMYSGEMSKYRVIDWMFLQAAGVDYVIKRKDMNYYSVPDKTKVDISKWMGDRLWIYNNDYGNNYRKISCLIRKMVDVVGIELVVIDNLMTLDIHSTGRSENEDQKEFLGKLQSLAKQKNIHIMLVAHPKKHDYGLIRLKHIAGSMNIGNLVDTAICVHRVNHDFKNQAKQEFGWKDGHSMYDCSAIIEIWKDREGSSTDSLIQLYFEEGSKRFKSYPNEYVRYGWESGRFVDANQYVIPFGDKEEMRFSWET